MFTVFFLVAAGACLSCGRDPGETSHRFIDGAVVETTDSAFVHDVLDPGRPAVVYYRAFGCIPCAMLGPHVKKLAARYTGRVAFWSLDMGWSAERVRRYDVRVVPMLVFYSHGQEIVRQVGMPTPATDDSLALIVEEGLRASR